MNIDRAFYRAPIVFFPIYLKQSHHMGIKIRNLQIFLGRILQAEIIPTEKPLYYYCYVTNKIKSLAMAGLCMVDLSTAFDTRDVENGPLWLH